MTESEGEVSNGNQSRADQRTILETKSNVMMVSCFIISKAREMASRIVKESQEEGR
jgi:hypothetical protein